MPKSDPRVDAYIARSADFARPILNHLRKLVHAVCPDAEETRARRLKTTIAWLAAGKSGNWKYLQ